MKSAEEFIRRITVELVPRGYFFYVLGEIPAHKDPAKIDAKIIEQYGIDLSRWQRARQKRQGLARLHYVRYQRMFVILATHGSHEFFQREAKNFRDARRDALRVFGYRISSSGQAVVVTFD